MTASLVALAEAGRVHDGGRIVALRDVNMAVAEGESVALLGPSGSGKSTILNLLGGLDRPTAGAVLWRGEEVRDRREWTRLRACEIGIVFQDFLLLPTLTAAQNVEAALVGADMPLGARRAAAVAALERVGLATCADRLPHALSGGERQRVAIARSVVHRPRLLLADEPTGNLDSANADLVEALLFDLQRERGCALVLVTHDPERARRCDRRLRVVDGRVTPS